MHSLICSCRRFLFATIIGVFLPAALSLAQEAQDTTSVAVDGTIHSPAEIFRLMELSELTYLIGELSDTSSSGDTPLPVLPHDLYVHWTRGTGEVWQYHLADSATALYMAAEDAYAAEDYDSARRLYRQTLELEPSFAVAITMIGDTYFVQGLLDSAIFYYEKAIASNFHSYQAHWFLADALWKTGDSLRAAEEITLAHLLNRNHLKLQEIMIDYCTAAGLGWDAWDFNPVYNITRDSTDGHIIHVNLTTEWIAYGIVKALWKFEPGYAERMLENKDNPTDRYLLEEREAVACQLIATDREDFAMELLDAGFWDSFILYEILCRKDPSVLYSNTPEIFRHLVNYLRQYH